MDSSDLSQGELRLRGAAVLEDLPDCWDLVVDPLDIGVFLRATPREKSCYGEWPLGRIALLRRFTSCHRFSPFWLKPAVGTLPGDVQPETLWLLAETADENYVLLVPLLDEPNRYALSSRTAYLSVTAETGDPHLPCTPGVALFAAVRKNPYELLAAAARAVARQLGIRALQSEKSLPDFVDFFGWCTWDAFYKEVSASKVLAGLETFASGGIRLPWLILDDGWQQWEQAATGEERLAGISPNERFGGNLSALVQECKTRWGVRRFFVWHALIGYWGGICPDRLPQYGSRTVMRAFGPGILSQDSRWNVIPWGSLVSVPDKEGIARFYEDCHSLLAGQGVDGVKVMCRPCSKRSAWGGEAG